MPAASFKLALLDDYQGIASTIVPWGQLDGVEVISLGHHVHDEDELAARLQPFDAVMAMRERTAFRRRLLERLPNLRLLVTTGPFNAAIDIQAAVDSNIVVCGTGGTAAPTAELTWGLIIALARQIPTEDASIRAGSWQRSVGVELDGKTLGVIGLGHLGRRVAKVGLAFGMDVLAWSQNMTAETAEAAGVRLVTFAELLERATFATIHLKLSERTHGLIGERELRLLGPDGYLVNTSRGPIVDEDALVLALQEGWIAGAGLDVFDEEPLRPDHPLRRSPRTVLTPHIGYVTDAGYRVFYEHAFEDVKAFLAGSPIRVIRP
ncbi:MAG TPA: D-2-hydroxyacid dehydrogenase family protein [Acidimicrobiales bacterium]|nr:D-2-hydroxyacid dehydrogenase family protein [Acidimicrobiales bacterium]